MKIGIITPTHSRPYQVRAAALQFNIQSVLPDVVYFFQNGKGNEKSYEHFIKDLPLQYEYRWLHNSSELNNIEYYKVPLTSAVEDECDYIFYLDDDDIYYAHHIESTIACMIKDGSDFAFRDKLDCMWFSLDGPANNEYDFVKDITFRIHAGRGFSSSIAFSRKFAIQLLSDMSYAINTPGDKIDINGKMQRKVADQIIFNISGPKFNTSIISEVSGCYVIHKGSDCNNWDNLPENWKMALRQEEANKNKSK